MVNFSIQIDSKGAKFMLTGYKRTIPNATRRGQKKLAKFSAMTYADQAHKAGIKPFTGKFYANYRRQSQQATKIGRDGFGVTVGGVKRAGVVYPIALDRMKQHWVSLKRGSKMTAWAEKYGLKGKAVRVSPHPYINSANRIIGRNINKFLLPEINNALALKGR